MKGILLQQTDIQELETMIRSIIREELLAHDKTQDTIATEPQESEPLLNKMEASQLLGGYYGQSLPVFRCKVYHPKGTFEACVI